MPNTDGYLNWLIILGMMGSALAYAAATFRQAKVKATAAALNTALQEVEAVQHKANRLEAEIAEIRVEQAEMRRENELLRGLLQGGSTLAQPLVELIRSEIQEGVSTILEAIEQRRG